MFQGGDVGKNRWIEWGYGLGLREPAVDCLRIRSYALRFVVMSGTNATYLLPIVHSDQEELAREIGDAVRDAAAEVVGGTAQVDVIAGVPDVAPPSTHVVLIYAGSRAGARDSNVDAEIEKALRSGHAVLPGRPNVGTRFS